MLQNLTTSEVKRAVDEMPAKDRLFLQLYFSRKKATRRFPKLREYPREMSEFAFTERVEQNLADSKKPRFSLAYRIRERGTLKNLHRPKNRLTVRAVRTSLTAAACLCLLITVLAYALISAGRYSFETKSDYSKLFIENISFDKTAIEEYYGLPEEDGWEILELNM